MRLIERSTIGISCGSGVSETRLRQLSGNAAIVLATLLAIFLVGFTPTLVAQDTTALKVQTDVDWWHPPQGKLVGDVSAVAVGPDGSVWVLHRPRSLPEQDRANAAPPVLKYDPDGRFLAGYGGPGNGYDWPQVEHSLALDAQGHFWVSGSFHNDPTRADDAILEFTGDGHFVKQIGVQGASKGDSDTKNVRAASDIYVNDATSEVYVSDGYANHRVVVFDRASGDFKRMWGAFGSQPPVLPPAGGTTGSATGNEDVPFFEGLHGIEVSGDGLVYVADRLHQRIQVFALDGKYQKQFSVGVGQESPQTASGIAFSADPAQRYLFVSDFGNSRVLVFDRKSHEQLVSIGGGDSDVQVEMGGPHLIASGRDGSLYVAEVRGRKVLRLTFSE
ncbi:MAG: NHL repeat-containing protein [Acidobacteria bacterium]|nr:NHL repeat-containing protein [Acidobacteriota bacterium]